MHSLSYYLCWKEPPAWRKEQEIRTEREAQQGSTPTPPQTRHTLFLSALMHLKESVREGISVGNYLACSETPFTGSPTGLRLLKPHNWGEFRNNYAA